MGDTRPAVPYACTLSYAHRHAILKVVDELQATVALAAAVCHAALSGASKLLLLLYLAKHSVLH